MRISIGLKRYVVLVKMQTVIGLNAVLITALNHQGVVVSKLTAQQFNEKYLVGHIFIYQESRFLRGGPAVRTLDIAKNEGNRVIVEINIHPYYVDIDSLTNSQ